MSPPFSLWLPSAHLIPSHWAHHLNLHRNALFWHRLVGVLLRHLIVLALRPPALVPHALSSSSASSFESRDSHWMTASQRHLKDGTATPLMNPTQPRVPGKTGKIPWPEGACRAPRGLTWGQFSEGFSNISSTGPESSPPTSTPLDSVTLYDPYKWQSMEKGPS